MSKSLRLTLPLCAVALMLVGWSIQSAMAQGAAKGKITVTVKDPAGAIAANVPVALLKGNVPLPAGGGGRRGGGGGAGGGAPPASQPAPLMSGTTNDKGVYTFEGVDAGEYTVFAGRIGGGGRRGGGGGGPGGAPPGGGVAPGGGAPATGPAAGGAPTGARGRGSATGTLEAGKELQLTIPLQAGRGGGGGGGGGRGGGAPGGAPGAGA